MILRLDDIGASSKQHERTRFGWGGWAPYPELTAAQLAAVMDTLALCGSTMTVAVTACWVERSGALTPYSARFPAACSVLRDAAQCGLVEIANHGLTHCVPGRHLPRWFRSNRQFHREFTSYLPPDQHREHLVRSQELLSEAFGVRPTVLVPPGGMMTADTVAAAYDAGIRHFSHRVNGLAFHDRDIALHGVSWLRERLRGQRYRSVSEELGGVRERAFPVIADSTATCGVGYRATGAELPRVVVGAGGNGAVPAGAGPK